MTTVPKILGAVIPRRVFTQPRSKREAGPFCLMSAPTSCGRTAARGFLFEHLVGAHQERFGDGQAEGLGGLEVDYQLELDWGLDWKLARICAL